MIKIPFDKNTIFLAPMAGVTDSGFRAVCRKYGADCTVSEMVSAKGIYYNDQKSKKLMQCTNGQLPFAIQIFGHEIECMKVATEYINRNHSPFAIDINMGCPAPKIFQNGDGCALMKNPRLAFDIIEAVKSISAFPVSVKFRSGIDESTINAVEFAKVCQQAGADFITIHARTREQFYSGKADANIIRDVVNGVSIPVIANGDICDSDSARSIFNYTGAYAIMIGRASLGNPLVFSKIKSQLTDMPDKYDNADIFDVAYEHLMHVVGDKGEFIAVKEFRKHLLYYLKGIKNGADLKRQSCKTVTVQDCIKIFNEAREQI